MDDRLNLASARAGSARTAYGPVPTDAYSTIEDGSSAGVPLPRRQRGRMHAYIAGACVLAALAGTLGGTLYRRSGASGSASDGCSYTGYRLEAVAVPNSYSVLWRPDFGEPFGFSGVSTIDVTLTADGLRCLQLHAYGLTVVSASVGVAGSSSPASSVPVVRYDVENQRVVLSLTPGIDGAPYGSGDRLLLTIGFNGSLGTDMDGLYRSSYSDDAGASVNMVATQFEATFARRAFVCFDEPSYKAVFNVSVDNVPLGYTALGNMPVVSEATNPDATRRVAFAPSPRMSTYLVALVVAPLVGVTGVTTTGVNVTAWAVNRANNTARLTFALDVALDVIPYYETLFNLAYPLPKMDMAAIPDFAAGAMENWGLLTYRETALLAKADGSSSSPELQRVSIVVAHESAHQWFGDIVTMAWWSGLFLNEGFASLVEYIGTDHATPQFEASRQFHFSTVLPAMAAVQWGHARSLVSPVDNSAEIESQFDGVSYSMGASLLTSVKYFMESVRPGSFFAGVGTYLRSHAFDNAEPDALWSALGDASGLPALPSYMAGYTSQTGFPIVTLEWVDPASRVTGRGVLRVRQSRYFFSSAARGAAPPDQADATWWVPLNLLSGAGGPNPVTDAAAAAVASGGFTTRVWSGAVGSDSAPFDLSIHGWVKANPGASSFYRVSYPLNTWAALAAGVGAQLGGSPAPGAAVLAPLDRAQLLDDMWALAEGGTYAGDGTFPDQPLNTSHALQLTALMLPGETSYEPWMPLLGHLATLRGLLYGDDGSPGPYAGCLALLEERVQGWLTPLVAALGWGNTTGATTDPPITLALRSAALAGASNFGLPSVVTTGGDLFTAWAAAVAGGATPTLSADLQPTVFSNAVRWGQVGPASGGGQAGAFDLLLSAAASTDDAATKRRYLSALAASRDRAQLSALLAASLNATLVRSQDSVSVITAVAGNPVGRDLAWAFTTGNWDVLMTRYGSGGFALSDLVSSTGKYFVTPASGASLAAWYTSHPMAGAQLEWQQAVEAVASRAGWRAGHLDATCATLAAMMG